MRLAACQELHQRDVDRRPSVIHPTAMPRSNDVIRLLGVGHGGAPTGFSRVLSGILESLPEHFEPHHFTINQPEDHLDARIPIYGNSIRHDLHGIERMAGLCTQLRPDIVLIMGDLWFTSIHAAHLRSLAGSPRLVTYSPVDGRLQGISYGRGFAGYDHIVAYTEFGREEIARTIMADAGEQAAEVIGRISVIPHAIDTHRFAPLTTTAEGLPAADRSAAKRLFFGADSPLVDSFIVLNANKHQPRKRIDLTIEGFARFAWDTPKNVKLYIHAGADWQGPDLRMFAERAGITDRLILSAGGGDSAMDDARLNLLYNACDVGINTSGGEGWGLVSFEHAATGAPQIVPRHSACGELWQGAAILLDPEERFLVRGLGIEWGFVSPDDVAGALHQLYHDTELRQSLGMAGYRRATQPQYGWKSITGEWERLLQDLVTERSRRSPKPITHAA